MYLKVRTTYLKTNTVIQGNKNGDTVFVYKKNP